MKKKIRLCPNCGENLEGHTQTDTTTTETYCTRCGLILHAQYTECGIVFPDPIIIIISSPRTEWERVLCYSRHCENP